MQVPVVRVREVLVRVSQRRVTMVVRVSPERLCLAVPVLVVNIVFVLMFVLHLLVRMPVAVLFGQVQPYPKGHERPGRQ